MTALILPHERDEGAVWRRFTVAHSGDESARARLLDAADALPDAVAHAVWPALLARVRGRAMTTVCERVARAAIARDVGPGVTYALVGALLGPAQAVRTVCSEALIAAARDPVYPAISLAVSLSARVVSARGATERERSALRAWCSVGGRDVLDGADTLDAWRAWIDGRDRPAQLDHALVLATAGAQKASVEHLRAIALRCVELAGEASVSCAQAWRWLAEGGAEGSIDPVASRASWATTGARVLALTAVRNAGPGAALRHMASGLVEGTALDRAVTLAVLRACIESARRGDGLGAASSLQDAVDALCDALMRVTATESTYREIVEELLGSNEVTSPEIERFTSWLPDAQRRRVLEVALSNERLEARRVALAEMDDRGVVPSALAALNLVAREDADPITRQHARQLTQRRKG